VKDKIDKIIKSDELKDLTFEITENLIDSNIKDEIISEIPIIKSIQAIRKIYNSISDQIFLKKILAVLFELKEINKTQRIEFISTLKDENSSGIEKLMIAIDNQDNLEKCRVFGRLCKLTIAKEINHFDLIRLNNILKNGNLFDFYFFKQIDREQRLYKVNYNDRYQSYANWGLLCPSEIIDNEQMYSFTEEGYIFHVYYNILFEEKPPEVKLRKDKIPLELHELIDIAKYWCYDESGSVMDYLIAITEKDDLSEVFNKIKACYNILKNWIYKAYLNEPYEVIIFRRLLNLYYKIAKELEN
jgi:hypothetical protein